MSLKERILQLEKQHGGLRPLARALDIDVSYLSRLKAGSKTNPTDAMLGKLGLVKVVTYEVNA